MSKGNNQDETPIRFHIPSIGKNGMAPIPLNQLNWKYATASKGKPKRVEWFGMGGLLLFSLTLLIFSATTPKFSIPLFIGGLIFTLDALWSLRQMVLQARYAKPEAEEMQKEKKVKQPNRRKDYK